MKKENTNSTYEELDVKYDYIESNIDYKIKYYEIQEAVLDYLNIEQYSNPYIMAYKCGLEPDEINGGWRIKE